MSRLGDGASARGGAVAALVLLAAALAGCVGVSQPGAQPVQVAAVTPSYFETAPSPEATDDTGAVRMGPYVATMPAGADSMLLELPLPPEARVTIHDDWNDEDIEVGFLVLDIAARDAEGGPVDLAETLALVVGYEPGEGAIGGTGWIPEKDIQASEGVIVSSEPWFLAAFLLPEKADHIVLTVSLRGEGVASVQAAFGWLPEEASGGLSPTIARAVLTTLGAPIALPVLAQGSGANLAFVVDAGGYSVSYGLEHTHSGTPIGPYLGVMDQMETAYHGPVADAGLQADYAFAYEQPGVVAWAWTYDGSMAAAAARSTGPSLFGLETIVEGYPGYYGYGMAEDGAVEATFSHTVDAGFLGFFFEDHLRIPLPLDQYTDLEEYGLSCHLGRGGACGAAPSLLRETLQGKASWTAQELVEAAVGALRP